MTEKILGRLLESSTISGQALSEELGVTRAAVWKQIERLRSLGFQIEAAGRNGYRLVACPDSLMEPMVRLRVDTKWAGQEICYFSEADSTNRRAKEMAAQGAKDGTLVIANAQTQGRGRRGRSWISPVGDGIFMSLILRPQMHPSRVAKLSLLTAVAVAQAIREVTGLDARIKWPNDVVCQGKKVCGMLLEMTADEECVHDVIVGVGINVHQKEFDEEIRETATSLELLCGRFIRRSDVVCAFLRRFEALYALLFEDEAALMALYRECSATLGRQVQVISLSGTFTGTAKDVTPDGALLVLDEDGAIREVLAADVSVRGVMGYA